MRPLAHRINGISNGCKDSRPRTGAPAKIAQIPAITACEMIDKSDSTRRELRMLAGFIVMAPTAVLIDLATYDALWHVGWLPQGAPIDSVDAVASLGSGVAILAVVVMVFGAIPGVVWMNTRRPLSLSNLACARRRPRQRALRVHCRGHLTAPGSLARAPRARCYR